MAKMSVPEPISWRTAERVARRVNGREPFSSSYLSASLHHDFTELTAQAEELVTRETGLRSSAGPARVRVTDRTDWVNANLASMRRLLRPLTERLGTRMASSPFAPVSRAVTGAQLGLVLGWMSARVLGQYDLLLLEDERPQDQDMVYYVGPNVLALEKRYAFPPREFRLWLALHECTHRAQFTGVPWMAEYFRTQVHTLLAEVDAEPKRLAVALRRLREELRSGRNPVEDGGMLAVLATPAQRQALQRIQGLMALLEGHGDVTMSRAGQALIPNADRFHRVLHNRRTNPSGIAKVLQRAIGMEAKLRQYEEGERFIQAVEQDGGPELFAHVWDSPETLPSYEEIRDPGAWVRRVQLGVVGLDVVGVDVPPAG